MWIWEVDAIGVDVKGTGAEVEDRSGLTFDRFLEEAAADFLGAIAALEGVMG